jgi:hypothetical protein
MVLERELLILGLLISFSAGWIIVAKMVLFSRNL